MRGGKHLALSMRAGFACLRLSLAFSVITIRFLFGSPETSTGRIAIDDLELEP